jgi:hypothetical protein
LTIPTSPCQILWRMSEDLRPRNHSLIRKLLRWMLWSILTVLLLAVARGYFAFHDRMPGYSVALDIAGAKSRAEPRPLRAGFARVRINPQLGDPKHPVWVAGFNQHRAATAIHDDLWAVACVIDDGWTRLGLVALDAIGFFHDDVVRVRRLLAPELKLDYAIVCSTHNHSTPDLMGLWGPDFLHTGVDPAYRDQVIAACARALASAVSNLEPVRIAFHEITTDPKNLVTDTRKPVVFDPDIRVMHFVKASSGETVGSIVGWADHPETPWGQNTEITADFCGYLRRALEEGVIVNGRKIADGLGGTHLYVNGAIGGLMTTSPSVNVHDPYLDQDFQEPSHDKAQALGRQLVSRILPRLLDTNAVFADHLPLAIRARTIDVPVENKVFLLAGYLGLIDRGYVRWRTLRSEVALIQLGDASIACVPGEIYPEIVNGGIENAPGGDFQIEPVEVPPLRQLVPGRIKFVFGLANDEIGYLIPKSEWDEKPPYLYGADHAPYGEINSVGPNGAGAVHSALKRLCQEAETGGDSK